MEWKIINLERQKTLGQWSNVVIAAHWECLDSKTVSETQIINARRFGVVELEQPSESFIAFENLTEQQVLTWVWQHINQQAIEQEVNDDLAAQQAPAIVSGELPWKLKG